MGTASPSIMYYYRNIVSMKLWFCLMISAVAKNQKFNRLGRFMKHHNGGRNTPDFTISRLNLRQQARKQICAGISCEPCLTFYDSKWDRLRSHHGQATRTDPQYVDRCPNGQHSLFYPICCRKD